MTAAASSLSDTLYKKLEAQILAGKLAPGARLPSQKDVAETENVSRTVVREAVARLAAQGLVVSRQGSGVYVAETAQYKPFQVTRDELAELADVIKLLEMRLALETEMAGLAAARRTTADIGAIREALFAMESAFDDPMVAARADSDFHLAIARATQNHYYERLIEFLGVRLVPPRNMYLRDESEDAHRAYAAKVRAEHEDLVDAIIRMDVPRARDAARHHMQESLSRHSQLSAIALLRPGAQSGD
ncbi:FadR/GntR family transcriptional regulator [Novosphingobium terrae]|uniref:FadR/GntR family transcriptional regulator n=1 Tax=Novosphingobium terrae TaxID=2726189 RepID=UPI002AC319B0|nr:FadR/GntR family transcriptional regulator [Novosphingobium terrae]